ncbi:MAG: hypothetical protein K0S71_1717 [Clostridia bacterium]|jgi:O-glycosyl hydrolase|nr:hypothetical protein [Clostridia bacterium]
MIMRKKLVALLSVVTLLTQSLLTYGNEVQTNILETPETFISQEEQTTPSTLELLGSETAPVYVIASSEAGIIKNPDFTEGLTGWENPGWASGDLMFSLDSTNGINVSACAKLADGNKAIEQPLEGLQPYTWYTLKAMVKGSAGNSIELGCEGSSKFYQNGTLTEDYQELSVDFETNVAGKARIYVYIPGNTSEAYIDNFSIELVPAETVSEGTITISPEDQYQTFDGWGTSLVWFANVIGGWSEANRTAISDLLFDKDKGLGLNIVRYNIGGGDAPGHDHMRAGGEMEGFATGFNGDGTLNYNWEADANQIQVLKDAIARGADITEAFSNTPPYFMTVSGCASGSDGGWANNLQDQYYDDFADYLTEVAKHFKENEGIEFDYLEPLNEPYTNYWKLNGGQEGCHFDVDKQEQMIQLTHQSLADKDLANIRVAAMDESILNTGLNNFKSFSQETKDSMDKWNVHTYGGNQRKETKNAAAMKSKDLWMSEVDLGGSAPYGPDNIVPGIEFARRITDDIKNIQPTAWVIWQAVENWPNMMPTMDGKQGENSNWGLILANFEGDGVKGLEAEQFRTTKKYYSMMQYSKFIRPGSVMLETNDDKTVAFYDKANGKLTFVTINDSNTENKQVAFNLTGFNSVGNTAKVYRTSNNQNCEQEQDVTIENGVLTDVIDRQSITTYVLENVVYDDSLIKLNESTITGETEVNRFVYNGTWDYYGYSGAYSNDNVWSSNVGDTATLHFTGSQAQIYGIKANNHGKANITVDGGTPVEVDLYSAFRDEDSSIFDTGILTNGQHTIVIEVTGNKNDASSGEAIALDYAKIYKSGAQPESNASIQPGTKWVDTKGERIQAHGGGIWYDKVNHKYYWYGEDKTNGYRPLRGVRCYTSTDLYNWTDEGLALRAIESMDQFESDAQLQTLYAGRTDKTDIFRDLDINTAVMERPKVIYNESTGKWVMWFHADGPTEWSTANYAKANAGVAISDSPTGPFTYIRSYRLDQDPDPARTNQGMARDMNLFVEDDGTAYIIYASEENGTLYISKLTDDYLDVAGWHKDNLTDSQGNSIRDTAYKGVIGTDYIRVHQGDYREAPAVFKYDDKYYLISSGCTGWAPNQAKYAMADSMFGPWTDMGDPCIGDGYGNTFQSQSTYVLPIDAENGKFMFMADRWTYPDDANLADSRYIWLPIKFESDSRIGIEWVEEWTMDLLDTMGKLKIITPMPEMTAYGITPQLPSQITVQKGGSPQVSAQVTWQTTQNTFKTVGEITVNGTLESGQKISFNMYVIPSNILYFVNGGDNSSEEYIQMKNFMGSSLINKTVNDQEFISGTSTWGYTGNTDTTGTGQGIYQSLRHVKSDSSNRNIDYFFKGLQPGKYTVYLGLYDPWAQWANGNRKANIFINDVAKQSGIVIDGNEKTYEYANIIVDQDLKVTIKPVNTGSNSDVQLSWLIVSKEELNNPVTVSAPQISASPESQTSKVTVTITKAQANGGSLLEYKLGVNGEWRIYESAFDVTENMTIYARAKDSQRNTSSEVSKVISNIEVNEPVVINGPQISTTPEGKTNKVTVTITAAQKDGGSALEYKLGNNGIWKTYHQAFEVAENMTIYARAKDSQNHVSNEVSKVISNIESHTPSTGGSSGNSNSNSTVKLPPTEQVINKLSDSDKKDIANNFKENTPYTSLKITLKVEQIKELTNNKFTDKQIQEMLEKPELLKQIGIDISTIITEVTLKSIKNASFKDVPEQHWGNESIKKAAELGLVTGMPDGTFKPKEALKVADTFTFLNRVLLLNNVTEMKLPRSTVEKYITDKENWAFSNIASVGSKLQETTLATIAKLENKPLSREILAQVLYDITEGKLPTVRENMRFKDIKDTKYKEAIDYCVATGLLNGANKDEMLPEKALTRAELMIVLIRLDKLIDMPKG